MITTATIPETKRAAEHGRRFWGMSTEQLIEDIGVFSDLLAETKDGDLPEPTKTSTIQYLEAFLTPAIEERERRRERFERHRNDTFPPTWPTASDYEELRGVAQDLKARMSIEEYIGGYVPHVQLQRFGSRFKSLCPFPDHVEKTPSFTIFEDGHAWCFGCNRGGDLFRIVGLIEGIERFRDQVHYVAGLLPDGDKIVPTLGSSRPAPLGTSGGRNHLDRAASDSYRPIRVRAGRAVS